MADPQDDGGQDNGGTGTDQAIDQRFSKIETEQREQRGVLDKILAVVSGPGGGRHSDPDPGPGPGAPSMTVDEIAAQVRREIAQADERRRAEEDDATWRAGVNDVVEKVKAEQGPRDPERGVRGRLQRILIGSD